MVSVLADQDSLDDRKILLPLVLSLLLATGYFLLLRSFILIIDFQFFVFTTDLYRQRALVQAILSSIGLFGVLTYSLIGSFDTRRSATVPLPIKGLLLLVFWFLSFLTIFSYQPRYLLNNSLFDVLSPLSWAFNLPAGIILALGFLFLWQYQLMDHKSYSNSSNSSDLTEQRKKRYQILLGRSVVVLFLFISAIIVMIPLLFVIYPLFADFGEGVIGTALVTGGLLSCYILARMGIIKYLDPEVSAPLDIQSVPNFVLEGSDYKSVILDFLLEMALLLLVALPAFSLMAAYITDSSFGPPFENAYIFAMIIFPLPLLIHFINRFD